MRVYVLFIAFLIIACRDTGLKDVDQEKENRTDSLSSTAYEEATRQQYKQFPLADTLIYTFFSQINEVERFIDPKQGVYCLESGQGASPQIEKLLSKEDLLGKTPFLFLCRDIDLIRNQVLVNPLNFDYCSETAEGYFVFDLKESRSILEDAYRIISVQEGNTPNDSISLKYRTIDQRLCKSVVVSFNSRYGDAMLLKFYFTKSENGLVLSIIDLRECGI